jgi:hypothetical protein
MTFASFKHAHSTLIGAMGLKRIYMCHTCGAANLSSSA